MWKYKYAVSYTLRPNKKSQGTPCVQSMSFSYDADANKGWFYLQAMRVLCGIHRVNPSAITFDGLTLISRELVVALWIKAKWAALMGRFR